ncbi:AMP-binding protein [Aliiglaciecola sp. 3_MG-2023]|uniref:AMP-binding protein n=1 Tax=Aliiglaciecola sp. 3_MG-2023 TaxID=3062644 RepID=UPI0026E1D6A7|nr:AMP-binding protein [Aliiglaciecola sp. 3_MG-2023]MDO6695055.1 AMP-binding protein [Aliiglaciecola sp. 3_MG-2023]
MSKKFSLSNWTESRPNQNVAIRCGNELTCEDFKTNVYRWHQALSQYVGQRWVVYHSDPFEFLSIVYALWYLKRVACVPGDNRPATISRLLNDADGGVGEMENSITLLPAGQDSETLNLHFTGIDREQVAVELYTSGSSGEPKAIAKTIGQLESELQSLEQQFPAVPGARILSTVSHQHLYGLTFRLLRPFSSGQPFLTELCEYTEDIFNNAQHLTQYVLVASPSHISRVNELLAWSSMKAECLNIFSAAAPLKKADALRMSKLLNAPLVEIYGSSETGVIAWRKQTESKGEARWQCVPDVSFEIEQQDLVKVCSDFVDKSSPYLNDQLKIHPDGSFELKGRSDLIVKIEGKRVSLNAIESVLSQHEWVSEAKAFSIARKRTEVAVVLILSETGQIQLMHCGRPKVIKTLRTLLLQSFETIVVPRRWRFVDTMPYNSQGKITLASLQALMEQPALLKWPIIKSIDKETAEVKIACVMPKELVYFDGHFEQAPILPGVVQVHWAQKYAAEYFVISGRFSHLEVIKFSGVIQPEDKIDLVLVFNSQKQKVSFSYRSDKGLHSSGRICFA